MLCQYATSEAGARRPRSSANYSDSSNKIVVTNLLTSTNDHMIRPKVYRGTAPHVSCLFVLLVAGSQVIGRAKQTNI
jgi:hypothetical protein